MTTLVCIDTRTGTLRRWVRGSRWQGIQAKPQRTGEARLVPWESAAPHARVVPLADVESFRQNRATGVALEPEVA
jgi:hypothetical protein